MTAKTYTCTLTDQYTYRVSRTATAASQAREEALQTYSQRLREFGFSHEPTLEDTVAQTEKDIAEGRTTLTFT